MDHRRRGGLVAMGAGLAAALLGELTSHHVFIAGAFALLATTGLIGGGVVVALTYREEVSGRPSTSRLSLLASAAGAHSARRGHASGGDTGEMALLAIYATRFNDEIAACEQLLMARQAGGGAVEPAALDAARERIVTFVANPSYGEATRRGLVDEERVRDISVRLAAAI